MSIKSFLINVLTLSGKSSLLNKLLICRFQLSTGRLRPQHKCLDRNSRSFYFSLPLLLPSYLFVIENLLSHVTTATLQNAANPP